MSNDLPFVGTECRQCGYFSRDEGAHICSADDDLEQRKQQFLNRFGWKFQREQAVRELDELIEFVRLTRSPQD